MLRGCRFKAVVQGIAVPIIKCYRAMDRGLVGDAHIVSEKCETVSYVPLRCGALWLVGWGALSSVTCGSPNASAATTVRYCEMRPKVIVWFHPPSLLNKGYTVFKRSSRHRQSRAGLALPLPALQSGAPMASSWDPDASFK